MSSITRFGRGARRIERLGDDRRQRLAGKLDHGPSANSGSFWPIGPTSFSPGMSLGRSTATTPGMRERRAPQSMPRRRPCATGLSTSARVQRAGRLRHVVDIDRGCR